MIKIVSVSLEEAYKDAASKLECSVTELTIEVVQAPSSGFLGLFKKSAIIVAAKKPTVSDKAEVDLDTSAKSNKGTKASRLEESGTESTSKIKAKPEKEKQKKKPKEDKKKSELNVLNDTIMPESFVSTQDDEDYDMADINFTADYDEDDSAQEPIQDTVRASEVAKTIEKEINTLFSHTCFEIDKIDVNAYDENTLLVEFKGEDAALLIGKEGYRYKALSYMIFNWINTKYQLQLRLEIAEFLKNQEESIGRYLVGVCENIDRDGRAQTKILDGVLVQIALKELRAKYPNKYVAIRSTRDGLKFIIINDYNN
ncbi:Jag N-terminal domain-containing protein [Sulfurimonas sp.]|uniref:Jag N-terminal domain-containing protein n=1 Tax=Sulfurimonas sp. TaxID=2022749 RepID=UPI00260AB458|nr:Jag N-terminal domain-containing protein [Sulfurimonas sp.]MCW8895958.1 Jag N-terminal domain-containing protein [Sulfurimonas sp.]MCW9067257.1 Jag N-terminal domain-containing protein [Sulfurimonas sp.]